jgi:DNA-binding transcriptional ArsR family regulator
MREGTSKDVSPRRVRSSGPLPPDVVRQTAERLRVVAKEKRIELLQELNDGEAAVQELADRVGISHQNASHHLALLWRAGILSRRHESSTTLYSVADWSAWWVVEQIAQSVRSYPDE